jgi:dinuclear metal center YbgI/SA1388 family protein
MNLIITHHPLLFRPLTSAATDSRRGRVLEGLFKSDTALVAMHTNLDFVRGGTSFALASALGISTPRFLATPYRVQKKIVTFVPAADVDRVAAALARAGAGTIGNYEECSFRIEGTGTFRGNTASRPTVGRRGVLEQTPEVRLEMVVPQWSVDGVVRALRAAHPYEEVAYDIVPTENRSTNHGMGVIGTLPRRKTLRSFLRLTSHVLGTPHLRYTGSPRGQIRTVAVCGGSGGDLLDAAIAQGADAFVTADVKYHAFHEAEGRIALIDAGHYETERPVVHAIASYLRSELRAAHHRIPVVVTGHVTNPIHYV